MPRKESPTVQLKLRLKEPLRAAIERAAKERDVSMNTEMVGRLERSLSDRELVSRLDDLWLGRDVVGFLMLAERVMTETGQSAVVASGKPGRSWLDDPYAYDRAVKAFLEVAEALRPEGPIPERPGDDWNPWPSFYMAEVAGGTAISQSEWAKAVRDRLGPVAKRLERGRKGRKS